MKCARILFFLVLLGHYVTPCQEEISNFSVLKRVLDGRTEYTNLHDEDRHVFTSQFYQWVNLAGNEERWKYLDGLLRVLDKHTALLGEFSQERWVSEHSSPKISEAIAAYIYSEAKGVIGGEAFLVHKKWASEDTIKGVLWKACEKLVNSTNEHHQASLVQFISRLAPERPLVSFCIGRFIESQNWNVRMEVAEAIGRLTPKLRVRHHKNLVALACDPPVVRTTRASYCVSESAAAILKSEELSHEMQLEYIRKASADDQNFNMAIEVLEHQKAVDLFVTVVVLQMAEKIKKAEVKEKAEKFVARERDKLHR